MPKAGEGGGIKATRKQNRMVGSKMGDISQKDAEGLVLLCLSGDKPCYFLLTFPFVFVGYERGRSM